MPDLVLSGTPTFNGDSSCTINSTGSDRVSVPDVSLVNKTQMWIAFRVKLGFAGTDTATRRFFSWGPDTNEELFLQHGGGGFSAWTTRRDSAGTGGQIDFDSTHASGDTNTIIAAFTASLVKLSVNGAAFLTAANALDPNIKDWVTTVWDIGQRGYLSQDWADSDFFWVAAGKGNPSDANASTIHGFGNTDQGLFAFPATPTFFWSAESAGYESVSLPAPRFDYSKFPKTKLRRVA